jgi:hypothetical protein
MMIQPEPIMSYLPSLGLRSAAATLALSLLATTGPACLACNDIGCDGGFEWSGRAGDNSGLVPGLYSFDITLDGSRFTLDCTVAETIGESDCGEPTQVEGDAGFDLYMDLSQVDPEEFDPSGPAGGFYLRAFDDSESDESGRFTATRGPQQVHITALYGGMPLIDVDYEITYERDDDYRGDERCGYCDERQARETPIVQ